MFYKFMFMLNMENILSRLFDQNNKIERDISRLGWRVVNHRAQKSCPRLMGFVIII